MASAFDYHFLYIDAALGPEWLFAASRRYWTAFHPIVVSTLDVIDLIPARSSLVITILARRDLAQALIDTVTKRFPRAKRDPLVYDVPADLQLTLDGRADYNQRFGLPEDKLP